MRTFLALGLLGLMIALPLAVAQSANDTPPATAGAPSGHGGPCPTDVNCTGGLNPGAGGPCPSDVNCTGGTNPNGGTCMDGQQGNESCDPHVYYLGGPADTGASNATTQGSDAPQTSKAVPAIAVAGIVGSAVVATVLVSRSRK